MLHLIKKDFLLVRRMGIIILLLAFATPLFLRFAAGDMPLPSGLSIASVSIILSLTLFNGVFQEEESFPRPPRCLRRLDTQGGNRLPGALCFPFSSLPIVCWRIHCLVSR